MTFREFMKENGYEVKTKFWEDFSLAERFGFRLFSTRSIVLSKSGKKITNF